MNNKLMIASIVFGVCAAQGQTVPKTPTEKPGATISEKREAFAKLTPQEQQRRIEARMKKVGGLVERPGSGTVLVVNCQSDVSEQGVKELFMLSSSCPIKLPFKCIPGGNEPFSISDVSRRIVASGAQAGVFSRL